MSYIAPKAEHKEILGFYGHDKAAAWDEAIRLAELLCAKHKADVMGVRAELQRGEWVVVLWHYDRRGHTDTPPPIQREAP